MKYIISTQIESLERGVTLLYNLWYKLIFAYIVSMSHFQIRAPNQCSEIIKKKRKHFKRP